ncbi:hypothetical protein MLD38_029578 [Melastoma candidum]|uniref:Uncharacterized protein n=1 Tax=Melastoma candidum TaxID=119954 RepID=A0ACB9N4K4_9MYRT|nr:hypothetical protein MLD38_029578 [Melastoma candidum]
MGDVRLSISLELARHSTGSVKMQSEYQFGAAMSSPAAATFGDYLTSCSASTAITTMASDFSGLRLSDSSYSFSNMAFLAPFNSVITPSMASSIEMTSTSQSQASTKEVSSLREQNLKLRSINHRLSLIAQLHLKNPPVPVGGDGANLGAAAAAVTAFDLANTYGRLSISETKVEKEGNINESPMSVMEGSEVDRMALPKSISVRSNDLWKGATSQNPAGNPLGAVGKGRVRGGCSPGGGKQKVYVRGGKKEEAPVELEVYNQGMFKTELCNKWQETGACPYGDHCDVCPFGHRCHFRHSLTEQEKLASTTRLPPATGELED